MVPLTDIPSSTDVPAQMATLHRFLFNGFKSFNPLSKVLFIFPSQYLFAIGFPSIFSLGRSISPIRAEIPSNPTLCNLHTIARQHVRRFNPVSRCIPKQTCLSGSLLHITLDYNSNSDEMDFQFGLFPVQSPLLGES